MVRFDACVVESPACSRHCLIVRAASDIFAAAARSISGRQEFKSKAAEEQHGEPRAGPTGSDLDMATVMFKNKTVLYVAEE